MKKVILAMFIMVNLLSSCSKQEEKFSCDEKVNEKVKKNRNANQSI
jgi:hypothetical protein